MAQQAVYALIRESPVVEPRSLLLRHEAATRIDRMFNELIGYFSARVIENFNPLFWLEAFIFLPQHILKYLRIRTEHALAKVLSILWWLFLGGAALFRDWLWETLVDLLAQHPVA